MRRQHWRWRLAFMCSAAGVLLTMEAGSPTGMFVGAVVGLCVAAALCWLVDEIEAIAREYSA